MSKVPTVAQLIKWLEKQNKTSLVFMPSTHDNRPVPIDPDTFMCLQHARIVQYADGTMSFLETLEHSSKKYKTVNWNKPVVYLWNSGSLTAEEKRDEPPFEMEF